MLSQAVGLKLTSQEVRPTEERRAGAGSSGAQQQGPSGVWGLQGHGLQDQKLLLAWQDRSGQHVYPEAAGYSCSESGSQTT